MRNSRLRLHSHVDEVNDTSDVTRELRRQSLKTRTIKFELGKATYTDIANAQRDLRES